MAETALKAAGETAAEGEILARRLPRICFVCTGNTCRSPMAAALFNELAARPGNAGSPWAAWRALSAGLYASGGPVSMGAVRALDEAGIASRPGNDYLHHAARNLSEEMAEGCERLVGVSEAHAMELLGRFPQCASKIYAFPQDLPDPYGGDDATYRACLGQLRDLMAALFDFSDAALKGDA